MAGTTPQAIASLQAVASPQACGTQPANGTLPVGGTPLATGTLPQGAQVVQDDKSTFSYQEIANLLLIKNADPVFQAALVEWDRKERELWLRVDQKLSRSADLKNQVYNIVALFSVFLGVVLTAVSQLAANQPSGSTPLCGKIWAPILLTGFGTIVTCIGVVYKFAGIRRLELSIQSEKQAQTEAARRGLTLRRKGPEKFRFRTDARNSKERKKPNTFWKDRIFVILSVLLFTAFFILSYFVILCDFWVIRRWNRYGIHG